MATDTAPAPVRPYRDPTRNLWQVPTLLVGAAVFVGTWQGAIPLGSPNGASVYGRDLSDLRAAAERKIPDANEIRPLVAKVAAGVEEYPDLTPTAHFALGSAYARLAELSPDPDAAKQDWTLAHQHLGAVDGSHLPDPADTPRLAFRAAKARAAVGVTPNTPAADVALTLSQMFNVPAGEDPGEANRLIAELNLRVVPPDYNRAKEFLTTYLTEANFNVPVANRDRAKLRLSEIYLAANDGDQARKWLKDITATAPPDVLAPAKAQLARILMREEDWAGAAGEWDQVRAAAGLTPGLKTQSAYYLGLCRLMTRQTDDAGKLFEEALTADGPESEAASLQLAKLALSAPDPAAKAKAVDRLDVVVKGVAPPEVFSNPLVPVNELRAAFEQAVTVLSAGGAFEPALRAAQLYAKVAASGKDREKRADVLTAWGVALHKSGGEFAPKFAAAAKEFLALAESQPEATRVSWRREAARRFNLAEQPKDVMDTLEPLLKRADLSADVSGSVLEEYINAAVLVDPKAAQKAVRDALATDPTRAAVARYKLARALIETPDARPEPKKAKVAWGWDLLDQLATAEAVSPQERDAQEKALAELGHEFLKSGKFAEAESRLQKLVDQYPTGPEAPLGKFLLGVCLLQQAGGTGGDAAAAGAKRDKALKQFESLVDELTKKAKPADAKLTDREAWLLTQSALRVLQTYLEQGKPTDVLYRAATMLTDDRYKGRAEELIVLSMMYHAYKQQNRPELMNPMLDRMRGVFEKLPPTAFPAPAGEYSRAYWEKVWFSGNPADGGPTPAGGTKAP